jgi:SAM-dependent methyltransferase
MRSLHWHAPTDVPTEPPPDLAGAAHASRRALEQLLVDAEDDAAWDFLALSYAEMAAEWPEWSRSQERWYASPVRAGLRHARPVRWAVEVGCGTGEATVPLAGHADHVISTDVNEEMIQLAPRVPGVTRVVSDVRRLPLATGSVPLLAGLNAVPHINEFNRVIAPGGQLLWCTSFGPGTPLYVNPQRLLELLGAWWTGEAGRAGHGEWLLLTRTTAPHAPS